MSMRGSRAGHMWVNLRDMRIARMDRKISVKPCADEFANYMKAVQTVGEEGEPPEEPGMILMNCLDSLNNKGQKASVKGHIKRFLKKGEK